MEGIFRNLAVLAAVTLISALPVVAADTGMGMNGDNAQKDQCLLMAQNCRDSVDSLQQRIDRLNREISRGTMVYSNEELRKLRFELKEAIETMEVLTRGGG